MLINGAKIHHYLDFSKDSILFSERIANNTLLYTQRAQCDSWFCTLSTLGDKIHKFYWKWYLFFYMSYR